MNLAQMLFWWLAAVSLLCRDISATVATAPPAEAGLLRYLGTLVATGPR